MTTSDRFLRIDNVVAIVAIGRSTIYRLLKQGDFPKPIQILGPRVVAWLEPEIRAWQAKKIAARDGTDAAA